MYEVGFFVILLVGFCRHDFNISVLKAFVSLSDFAGMILVQALRLVCILYSRICCIQTSFSNVYSACG